METVTDWIKLWRELVEIRSHRHAGGPADNDDAWRDRARGYHRKVMERWSQPDSSRTFLLSQVDANTTVLDVGAGTGSWTLLLAAQAAQVTAVDPSPAMLDILKENVVEAGLDNVSVVRAAWPNAEVEPHDLSLCAHAMYGVADFPHFVGALLRATRQRCCLLMRAPLKDSVMSIAAQLIWGQPHDTPNFVVGYNALLQMGIYPHVLMEDTDAWGAWRSETLEDALDEVKRKLGIADTSAHDDFLQGLLAERLSPRDGEFVWPPSMRSALLYWDVD